MRRQTGLGHRGFWTWKWLGLGRGRSKNPLLARSLFWAGKAAQERLEPSETQEVLPLSHFRLPSQAITWVSLSLPVVSPTPKQNLEALPYVSQTTICKVFPVAIWRLVS